MSNPGGDEPVSSSPGRVGASPRARAAQRRAWIAALTAALHGVLLAMAWHASVPRERPGASRVAVRWVQAVAPRERAMTSPVVSHAARPVTHRSTAQAHAAPAAPERVEAHRATRDDERAALHSAQAAAPAASSAPIVGVAFGPPRIGLLGAAPARWGSAPLPTPPAAPPPPDALLAQMAQAQAAREAARAQIAGALQRTLASAPTEASEGACSVSGEAEPRLSCDNEVLMQSLAPREAALSGLLRAYRSMEPRTSGLAIAVVQGRYQVSWSVAAQLQ